MKRLFLHLITALLTFSVGSFLHMYVTRADYNREVAAGEARKRDEAESLAPRPSPDNIELAMRLLGCADGNEAVWTCVYAIPTREAWPEACKNYRRMLAEQGR